MFFLGPYNVSNYKFEGNQLSLFYILSRLVCWDQFL